MKRITCTIALLGCLMLAGCAQAAPVYGKVVDKENSSYTSVICVPAGKVIVPVCTYNESYSLTIDTGDGTTNVKVSKDVYESSSIGDYFDSETGGAE